MLPPLRRAIFDSIHGISHPSARATTRLLRQKFVWSGLSKDAKAWSRACLPCQSSKVHCHTESGIGTFHVPERRFSHIHVDVVGPLPSSANCKYIFPIVEKSTRWPEAVSTKTATDDAYATALHITSDSGSCNFFFPVLLQTLTSNASVQCWGSIPLSANLSKCSSCPQILTCWASFSLFQEGSIVQ